MRGERARREGRKWFKSIFGSFSPSRWWPVWRGSGLLDRVGRNGRTRKRPWEGPAGFLAGSAYYGRWKSRIMVIDILKDC